MEKELKKIIKQIYLDGMATNISNYDKRLQDLLTLFNRKSTFEDYLQQQHAQQYTGTDDNMPDDFNKWLEQWDTADILEMVREYEELN